MRSFLQHLILVENIRSVVSKANTESSFPFWFNPTTNKAFIVPRGTARNGPWHATIIAQNPTKYGLTKKKILEYMKKYDEEKNYHIDFDQTPESFYDDIVNRVKDVSEGIEVLMGEMGYFRCTYVAQFTAYISARCGGEMKPVSQSVSVWKKLVEYFSLIPSVQSIHMEGFDRPQGLYTPLGKDSFDFFLRYGKIPARTEIGRTMAQFREETELSEAKKKIRVFDFDDTLVKTDAYVIVTDKDGNKKKLSPAEYAVYTKRRGEVFDYSQFHGVMNPQPLRAIEKILREVLRSGGKAEILTARGNYEPIKAYLKMRGIEGIFVHALGSSDPKLKGAHLQALINSGYDFIEFFDDSPKNIEAAKEVAERNKDKAKIRLRHIK